MHDDTTQSLHSLSAPARLELLVSVPASRPLRPPSGALGTSGLYTATQSNRLDAATHSGL
eukprot:52623-Eustigmatos_ZCMA.PRE.1